jgi:hypothetical protein
LERSTRKRGERTEDSKSIGSSSPKKAVTPTKMNLKEEAIVTSRTIVVESPSPKKDAVPTPAKEVQPPATPASQPPATPISQRLDSNVSYNESQSRNPHPKEGMNQQASELIEELEEKLEEQEKKFQLLIEKL